MHTFLAFYCRCLFCTSYCILINIQKGKALYWWVCEDVSQRCLATFWKFYKICQVSGSINDDKQALTNLNIHCRFNSKFVQALRRVYPIRDCTKHSPYDPTPDKAFIGGLKMLCFWLIGACLLLFFFFINIPTFIKKEKKWPWLNIWYRAFKRTFSSLFREGHAIQCITQNITKGLIETGSTNADNKSRLNASRCRYNKWWLYKLNVLKDNQNGGKKRKTIKEVRLWEIMV